MIHLKRIEENFLFNFFFLLNLGNETITIDGSNFPNPISKVAIGSVDAEILSSTSTQITIKSPKMNPGVYKLSICIGSLGFAK